MVEPNPLFSCGPRNTQTGGKAATSLNESRAGKKKPRCSSDCIQNPEAIFLRAGIELRARMIDGIADHGNRGYRSFPGGGKSKERCGLHLDREGALASPLIELSFGFAVRGVRRPHLAGADGPPSGEQLPLKKRNHPRVARDLTAWWQVVIRGSLIPNGAGCHYQTREG